MRATYLLCLGGLIIAGCIPLPIPHKVTPHPRISGRVVDVESVPVAGATVEVDLDGTTLSATTSDAGDFVIEPVETWRYLWVLPLVPFDPVCSRAELRVVADGRDVCEGTPGELIVCGPTVLLGDTGQRNRENPRDLGIIKVCPRS